MTAPYDDPTKVTQIIPRVREYRDEVWCPHCENFRPEGPGKHRDDLLNDDPDAITVWDLMDRIADEVRPIEWPTPYLPEVVQPFGERFAPLFREVIQ